MNKLHNTINRLKEKRKKLLSLKEKRLNCDTIQFYEDSTKLTKIRDGMIIIIAKDKVVRRKVPSNVSHERIAQDIFEDTFGISVNFSDVNGDFGNIIASEYGYIFIRMTSVLCCASMVYYPVDCNGFQISELNKFNNDVNTYNASKKDNLKACFDYNDKGNEIEYNVDNIIAKITKKKHI